MKQPIQDRCDNCSSGHPMTIHVRYSDRALRRVDYVACMKGVPIIEPAGKPVTNYPKPRRICLPSESCPEWTFGESQ